MIALIYGADELGKQRRLRQLREEADAGSGMLQSNLTVIAGRDAKPEDILMQAMAVPFLAPHRLVVVEDILARFNRAAGSDEREARAVRQFQPLFDALKKGDLPGSTMLVFTGGQAGDRHPFVSRIKDVPGSVVEEYPELSGDNLHRWIREEAAMLGIRFKNGPSKRPMDPDDEWQRPNETDPVILLANLHPVASKRGEMSFRSGGGDALAIANELEKLAVATMGREVTVDDVDVFCGGQRQVAVWALTDALHDGRAGQAMSALQAMRNQGVDSQSLIGMIASSYRNFATVLDLLEEQTPEEQIGIAIGRKWPAGRQMAIRRAKALGETGLRAVWSAIVAADRSIKAGEVDEDLAVEILVMQLAKLSTPPRRR